MDIIGRPEIAFRKPLRESDLRTCQKRNVPIPVSMLNNPVERMRIDLAG